jgi:hypothetical protein
VEVEQGGNGGGKHGGEEDTEEDSEEDSEEYSYSRRKRRRGYFLIKSNNPYLTGGEIQNQACQTSNTTSTK